MLLPILPAFVLGVGVGEREGADLLFLMPFDDEGSAGLHFGSVANSLWWFNYKQNCRVSFCCILITPLTLLLPLFDLALLLGYAKANMPHSLWI